MNAKTFNIAGKESLLKAMAEDLEEIGYNILNWREGEVKSICTNAHNTYSEDFNKEFTNIYPMV